uniref:Uncharacterized protein n=1 Tax=Plectus sambesii TaxID=2011161 RepID=A0A914X9V0_9BILA
MGWRETGKKNRPSAAKVCGRPIARSVRRSLAQRRVDCAPHSTRARRPASQYDRRLTRWHDVPRLYRQMPPPPSVDSWPILALSLLPPSHRSTISLIILLSRPHRFIANRLIIALLVRFATRPRLYICLH